MYQGYVQVFYAFIFPVTFEGSFFKTGRFYPFKESAQHGHIMKLGLLKNLSALCSFQTR